MIDVVDPINVDYRKSLFAKMKQLTKRLNEELNNSQFDKAEKTNEFLIEVIQELKRETR